MSEQINKNRSGAETASKIRYRLVTVFGAVAAICILIAWLFTAMQFVCYRDYDMYIREYEKYDVLSDLPAGVKLTGENSLRFVTEHMMKYLIGDKDTPDLQCSIDTAEGTRDFFVERELLHMADCRVLFKKALQLRYICIMAAVFLFVYSKYAVLAPKRGIASQSSKEAEALRRAAEKRPFAQGMKAGTAIFFIAAAALAAYFVFNFSTAFVQFHLIFFDNDLWLLDPRESLLINILPEGFFFDVVKKILAVYLPGVVLLLVFVFMRTKKQTKSV